jgi:hypothetical protein
MVVVTVMPTMSEIYLDSHLVIDLLEQKISKFTVIALRETRPSTAQVGVGELDGVLGVLHMDTSTDPSKPEFDMLLEVANLNEAYFEFTQMPTH